MKRVIQGFVCKGTGKGQQHVSKGQAPSGVTGELRDVQESRRPGPGAFILGFVSNCNWKSLGGSRRRNMLI